MPQSLSQAEAADYQGWCRRIHAKTLHYYRHRRLLCGRFQAILDRQVADPHPEYSQDDYFVLIRLPDWGVRYCRPCHEARHPETPPAAPETEALGTRRA